MNITIVGRALGMTLLCSSINSALVAQTSCRHDGPFLLAADDGLLSVEAEDICLSDLVQALADRGYAEIHLPPSLADKPVNVSFHGLPLQQAIKRMLKDISYVLQTKSKQDSSAEQLSGVEVWLIPERSASDRASDQSPESTDGQEKPIDPAAVAEQSRSAPEPEARAYAIQLIAQSDDRAKAAELILAGLQDPAPQVRSAALMAMAGLDSAVADKATALVADIALHDESPELRKQALLRLAEDDPRSETTARVMTEVLQDENPDIRNLARELSKLADR